LKIKDTIVLAALVLLTLTPPWTFNLTCDMNSLVWLWGILLAGFSMFYICTYSKINLWAKGFLLWAFVLCFLSKAPYISFTMYWSLIAGAIYYVLCTQVEDREPFYKAIQAIFFLVVLLLVMQLFGKDTLLNFNMKTPCILGTIGNRMIFGSFVMCMAPFLLRNSWLNLIPLWLMAFASQSSGPVLSVACGTMVFAWHRFKKERVAISLACVGILIVLAATQNEVQTLTTFGRGPVWKRTVELSVKNPLGYGGSTYKLLFPLYSQDLDSTKGAGEWEYDNTRGKGLAWRRAHNAVAQILFEYGFPGLVLAIGFFLTLLWRSRKDISMLSGLVMVAANMITAFPERSTNMVLLLLTALAFCERKDDAIRSL